MVMESSYLPTEKIAVISLSGDRRVLALSAYSDGVLAIQKMEPLKGAFQSWREELKKKIEAYKEVGFLIYIESHHDYFDDYGLRFKLDETDPVERRTYQNIALDNYYSMIAMGDSKGNFRGNIRLPTELKRYWITSNQVNLSQDEKGRNKYDIEDGRLSGFNRALLVSVLAVTHFIGQEEKDLNTFLNLIGLGPDNEEPPSRMENVLHGVGNGHIYL